MNSPYIYCNGNPVKYVDPDGEDACNRISKANSLLGIPYKQEGNVNGLRTEDTSEALEYMDCSEFICRILVDDGIIEKGDSYDSRGLLALSQGSEFEQSETPQAGDIIAWNGHVALVETYDSDSKKVTVMHATKYNKSDGTKVSSSVREQYSVSYYEKKGAVFFHPKEEKVSKKDGLNSQWSELKKHFNNLRQSFQELRQAIKDFKENE